jgi:hypothetical protein
MTMLQAGVGVSCMVGVQEASDCITYNVLGQLIKGLPLFHIFDVSIDPSMRSAVLLCVVGCPGLSPTGLALTPEPPSQTCQSTSDIHDTLLHIFSSLPIDCYAIVE